MFLASSLLLVMSSLQDIPGLGDASLQSLPCHRVASLHVSPSEFYSADKDIRHIGYICKDPNTVKAMLRDAGSLDMNKSFEGSPFNP